MTHIFSAMDLTRLPSIAKFAVGDTVLKWNVPHRVVGRYWSAARDNIVYDLVEVGEGHHSVQYKVGEGLLKPVPQTDRDGHLD